MSAATLTDDQRRLLSRHCGGWLLAATIVDPDYGISSLKSRAGGKAWPRDLAPELSFNHTETTPSGIAGTAETGDKWERVTVVSVTYTEIRRWVAQIPDDTKAELRATFKAMADEQNRTINWCLCPWKDKAPNEFTGPCKRYHPSDAEDAQRWQNRRDLDARQDDIVEAALWPTAKQLDLFEAV